MQTDLSSKEPCASKLRLALLKHGRDARKTPFDPWFVEAMAVRRFSAGAVNNLQIGGASTRIIYNGVLLSKF